jgi:hypothetical protein
VFCHGEDERPAQIYAFRGDAVLTFDPRFFISVAAFLLPMRRCPLSSLLLGNSPWGWNSDDHRCCKNGAGCSLAGFGSAPITSAISVMEFTTFPLNPSPTRRKSLGEFQRRCGLSALLVARRMRK